MSDRLEKIQDQLLLPFCRQEELEAEQRILQGQRGRPSDPENTRTNGLFISVHSSFILITVNLCPQLLGLALRAAFINMLLYYNIRNCSRSDDVKEVAVAVKLKRNTRSAVFLYLLT